MKMMRHSKLLIAVFALLLIFAGCKGESPTAPQTGSGGSSGGGTTPQPPPTGNTTTTLSLAASSQNPLVDSTVTITATVTIGGQPAPNGTAVEFAANGGGFDNTASRATLKTTTNGVATVTLTSTVAGPVRVQANVNNVQQAITVTFQTKPVIQPPPNTAPSITSVSPTVGRPAGGETIRITGTNFTSPVRVLFNTGGALPVEAFVVSVSPTEIQVVTPAVNLGAGQQFVSDITVITQAGTANEQRASAAGAFTYRNDQLTPVISAVTPNSGPVVGGTMVTLFGEGFQAPVQVLFGAAEARVISVDFSQIIVETPAARDTSNDGSGPVVGVVPVIVRNILSNTSTQTTQGGTFRYTAAVQITAAGPTEGPYSGGTRVEIDGNGFVGPVAVTIGGVAAQPIFVSGTKIIAVTSPITLTSCNPAGVAITVTNIVNGDSATGPVFTYRVPLPTITSVSQNNVAGGTVTITVANAVGTPRLAIGQTSLPVSSAIDNGNGTTTFTAVIPPTVALNTQACEGATGVTTRVPTTFDISYTSALLACLTDKITNGITVTPPPNTPVIATSGTFTGFSARITPATPGNPTATPPVPATPATVAPSAPQTVTFFNSGTGTLTINSVTPGAGCGNFSISTPTVPAALATCDSFPVTAIYNGTTTPSAQQCTVTIGTSAGTRTLTLSGTSQ
ncbi:MAG: IPT/TIG domain-containing protein [Acidobacteriota bacterium]|nr:IPT/TIG domain-containing protein [Acidobacteriota bacterium]